MQQVKFLNHGKSRARWFLMAVAAACRLNPSTHPTFIMNHTEIRLLWNGTDWEIDSSGPPHGLVAGTEFLIRLPVAAGRPVLASAPRAAAAAAPDIAIPAGEGGRLFPAGTWLYLPLTPVKHEDKLWALWVAHREAEKPSLAKSPDKPLVPILLEEDLRFAHAGSRGLAACRCRIGERGFDSLNQAASHALLEWNLRSPRRRRDAVERSMPMSLPHSVAVMPMFSRWAARNSCGGSAGTPAVVVTRSTAM